MRQVRAWAVLIVVVILLAFAGTQLHGPQNTARTQTTTGVQAPAVTLEDLMAGKYPTALDRNGTEGTTVRVRNLLVLYVRNESDGDWHVGVTDGKVPVVITEITPAYQAALGRPAPGTAIDEVGKVFCDVQHENESWHGGTCWEVHPVTQWSLSGSEGTQTGVSSGSMGTNVSVSFGEEQVVRGYNQTIRVTVTGSGGPMVGDNVSILVRFLPDGHRSFSCTASADGTCSVNWAMGDEVGPGTIGVDVQVAGTYVYSAFEVLAD